MSAQPVGGQIEGFHVRAGFPLGPERRQIQRFAAANLRLPVVVLEVGRLGRDHLLGHGRVLVGDDVVRPAPHGGGGAQLLAGHLTGEGGALV